MLILAILEEWECRVRQKMWQIPKTFQSSPCANRDSPLCHAPLAFLPVEHVQKESTRKVILYGVKKTLNDAIGIWAEHLNEMYFFFLIQFNLTTFLLTCAVILNILSTKVIWSYHTMLHLTTKERPFKMFYAVNLMFLVDIDMPL